MFAYELDIKNLAELWFFLFRPKTCPSCRQKVYRVDVLPEFSSEFERDGTDFTYTHRTRDRVRYRCDPCHAYYSLTELVKKA